MVEIGGKPILWHILKIYSHYGINDFIICCGYKGYAIKEYFFNYSLHQSDVTIDLKNNELSVHKNSTEPWKITLVDTGQDTMTGGRLARIQEYIDETFCLTYGDGVSDINIHKLLEFHKLCGTTATLTAVQPPGRYGALSLVDDNVDSFTEKPIDSGGWVNGGFFVMEPSIFELLKDDKCILESEPLKILAQTKNLSAYKHTGFWQSMDSLRDKKYLEELWSTGDAPWAAWEEK